MSEKIVNGMDGQAASVLGVGAGVGQMLYLRPHPLASQHHVSADLGTGVGLHRGSGSLTDTINPCAACF